MASKEESKNKFGVDKASTEDDLVEMIDSTQKRECTGVNNKPYVIDNSSLEVTEADEMNEAETLELNNDKMQQNLLGSLDMLSEDVPDIVINVKKFGAKGDGIADDTAAINSALISASGKTLFFPEGIYMVKPQLRVNGSLGVILKGGDNSIIKAFPLAVDLSITSAYLLYITSATNNISIEGLEFDGNRSVAELIRIANPIPNGLDAMKLVTSKITIKYCKFYRGLLTTGTPNNVSAIGVYVRGAFDRATFTDCYFKDFDSSGTSGTSRGIVVAPEYLTDNWTNNILIKYCHFEDIYKTDSSIDSEGVYVNNNYSKPYASMDKQRATVQIVGCTFKNCRGRSYKSQVGSNIIQSNIFIRNKWDGNMEIDLQRQQGIVSGNTFIYDGFYAPPVVVTRNDIVEKPQVVITNNTVNKLNHITGYFVGLNSGMSEGKIEGILIQGNNIDGTLEDLVKVRVDGLVMDNELTVINNTIVNLTRALVCTWRYGIGTGVLRGMFSGNINKGSPVDIWFNYQPSFFYPDVIEKNSGFNVFEKGVIKIAASDATDIKGALFICDGKSDNVEISKACELLIPFGGKIVLSDGHFYVNRSGSSSLVLEFTDGLSLHGSGIDKTFIVKVSTTAQSGIANLKTTDRLTYSDFTFDGKNTATTGIEGLNSGGSMKNVKIINCRDGHIYPNQSTSITLENIIVENCSGVGLSMCFSKSLLRGCKIKKCDTGVYMLAASYSQYDLLIEDTIIEGCTNVGFRLNTSNNKITGVTFNRCTLKDNVESNLSLDKPNIENVLVMNSSIGGKSAGISDSTSGLKIINSSVGGITANRLKNKSVGQEYFDMTLGKKIIWNGTDWTDFLGGKV